MRYREEVFWIIVGFLQLYLGIFGGITAIFSSIHDTILPVMAVRVILLTASVAAVFIGGFLAYMGSTMIKEAIRED